MNHLQVIGMTMKGMKSIANSYGSPKCTSAGSPTNELELNVVANSDNPTGSQCIDLPP